MNEFFVRLYWATLRKIINKSNLMVLVLTGIISYLIFCLGEYSREFSFLSIPKATWVAVTASVLASTLFFCIQSLINYLRDGEICTYKHFYERIIDGFGVKEIYDQRGCSEIKEVYKLQISESTKRIWAFGMTNRHFVDQHFNKIIELITSKDIDVLITYWNPSAYLVDESNGKKSHILEIQQKLEGNAAYDADWKKSIEKDQARLIERVSKLAGTKGTLRVANITTPSNFSCLIIDDDIFFFPFLAGPESTNDPMLYCSGSVGIGKAIFTHFSKITNDSEVVKIVYGDNL